MDAMKNRLKEPSWWASLAALVPIIGAASSGGLDWMSATGAILAALAGVFLPERVAGR